MEFWALVAVAIIAGILFASAWLGRPRYRRWRERRRRRGR
jgi:hypothetical protein